MTERGEHALLRDGEGVCARREPEELGPRQPAITALGQRTLLGPTHLIHRVQHQPHHMEAILDDLRVGLGHRRAHRLLVRLPQVHRDHSNGRALRE